MSKYWPICQVDLLLFWQVGSIMKLCYLLTLVSRKGGCNNLPKQFSPRFSETHSQEVKLLHHIHTFKFILFPFSLISAKKKIEPTTSPGCDIFFRTTYPYSSLMVRDIVHYWSQILFIVSCISLLCVYNSIIDLFHWPQYMDSWLARFCILVNACHRKPLGSHFTPVKTLDRHTDLCTCQQQCMKCNRWQVFSFKFHENSEKKNGKVPKIFKTLKYLLKIAKKNCWC